MEDHAQTLSGGDERLDVIGEGLVFAAVDFTHFQKGVQPALGSSICLSVFIRFWEDLIPKPRQNIEPFREFARPTGLPAYASNPDRAAKSAGTRTKAVAHETGRAGTNTDSTRWEQQGRQSRR